jgi:hypothetical protein
LLEVGYLNAHIPGKDLGRCTKGTQHM